MKNVNTTKRTPDPAEPSHIDWTGFDSTSAAERRKAALADPDAQPITPANLERMRRTAQAKVIRRALGLTQEEFSARYLIPLGTLRDWEQGRTEPDQPARAYLRVIARDPDGVSRALQDRPEPT
jgi:putative transcriptional regulator